jgi:hypothetical protein
MRGGFAVIDATSKLADRALIALVDGITHQEPATLQ